MLKPRREFYNRIRLEYPVTVLYAGQERCAPGHRSEGARTHYLFHYVLDGHGRVGFREHATELGPGDGFLFGPGQHYLYEASSDTPWHYAWVGFTGSAAENILKETGLHSSVVIRGPGVLPQLRDHFYDLVSTLRMRRPGFSIRSDGYLMLILSHLHELIGTADHGTDGPRQSPESYVEEAFNFIQANFQRDIDVGSVVEYVGLERSYFSALFRRTTGQSVQDYLIGYRMRKAREYLRNTGYTVNDIAASVGYASYFSFARRFRRLTGMTPTTYRDTQGT